ncbi:hypothetical protein C2G38_1199122 [Gigaspora rosea]|uniref:Uncharacterized protein n=1 Tax=Gigaspora rosea TaxID=44941 RepID=A0A397W7G1_9GLOM|nr:hypothetical protein C2G38_1199122 [Gigaspora rosea]
MILGEIYQRYRKTEPLKIHIMRIITMIFCLLCILVFTISIIYDIINDQPVISYSYIKEDLPVPDIQFFSENMFVMTCNFMTSEVQNINMFYDRDCNSYITDPLEKDGSYYNGYFSIPLENSYKLALSNNTKYGKRSEQEIRFFLQILDLNVDLNASYLVQISDSENVDLGRNISSLFLQSISQANTYKILQGYLIRLNLSRSIRKFIIPNWKAIMGFRPDYIIKPYITSRKGNYITVLIFMIKKGYKLVR